MISFDFGHIVLAVIAIAFYLRGIEIGKTKGEEEVISLIKKAIEQTINEVR